MVTTEPVLAMHLLAGAVWSGILVLVALVAALVALLLAPSRRPWRW
jgi:hypothetical protein